MRISVVSETFIPQVNGVSRTLDRLVRHLTSQGDRVPVVIPRYREAPFVHAWRGARTAGCPGDILREGETGMFAGRIDAESLARAMHSLLSQPERMRTMGVNARGYAERQNWKDILEHLRHTYQTIIATPSLRSHRP